MSDPDTFSAISSAQLRSRMSDTPAPEEWVAGPAELKRGKQKNDETHATSKLRVKMHCLADSFIRLERLVLQGKRPSASARVAAYRPQAGRLRRHPKGDPEQALAPS